MVPAAGRAGFNPWLKFGFGYWSNLQNPSFIRGRKLHSIHSRDSWFTPSLVAAGGRAGFNPWLLSVLFGSFELLTVFFFESREDFFGAEAQLPWPLGNVSRIASAPKSMK